MKTKFTLAKGTVIVDLSSDVKSHGAVVERRRSEGPLGYDFRTGWGRHERSIFRFEDGHETIIQIESDGPSTRWRRIEEPSDCGN